MVSLKFNDQLLGLLLLICLFVQLSFGRIKLMESSSFPMSIESTFRISFITMNEIDKFECMIMEIVKNGKVMHSSRISYATFLHDNEYDKPYYSELHWKSNQKKLKINIKFNRNANKCILRFRYIKGKDTTEFTNQRNIFQQSQVAYKSIIQLKMPPVLYLTMMTHDKNQAALAPGRVVDINCTARGGIPEVKPYISFPHKMYGKVFNANTGDGTEVHTTYWAHVKDHGHYVYCNAGSKSITHTIRIYHHPSYITFDPAYTSRMPNGSSVRCLSNGYPPPNVKWEFLSGPENHEKYYKIDGNKLTLNNNAPMNSKWIFNCSAMNTNSQDITDGTLRTFQFTVKPLINKAMWISITSAIILVIIIIIIIIYIHYKKCCRKNASESNHIEAGNSINQNKSYFQYQDPQHYVQEESTSPTNKKKNHHKKNKPPKRPHHYDEDDGNEEMIV